MLKNLEAMVLGSAVIMLLSFQSIYADSSSTEDLRELFKQQALFVSKHSISFELDDKEILRIERDGTIMWKEGECKDFKDLAKSFMYLLFKMSPETDWRGVAPEIYEEIKHLIVEKKKS